MAYLRVACVVFALSSAGCSWIHVKHCTYWNILPAFGINYFDDVCPGGQPTQTERPKFPAT